MLLLAVGLIEGAESGQAEDTDRFRPYMHWRAYEWDVLWNVHDANGISLGANFNKHWGMELALDAFQLNWENAKDQRVAELTTISLLPQVRWRYPLLDNRLVPYVIAGVGPSFLQFNDRKSHAFGIELEASDWKASATAGIGMEYFLNDEIAFGFEGKYVWIDELDTRIGDVLDKTDTSSFLVSFGLRAYFDENHPRPLVDQEGLPFTSRLYFGMRGGIRLILDGDIGNGIKLTPLAQASGHELNKHYGFAVGYSLNRNWAVEFGADGGETTIQVDDKYAIGEYAQVAIMPQVIYRWPLDRGRWIPYFSAAGGILFAEFNDAKPQSVGFDISARGFYPVVRGGVGLEYFFTRNFSFGAETHYQYSWGQEFSVGDRPTVTGDCSSFQALLMFRMYLFDL